MLAPLAAGEILFWHGAAPAHASAPRAALPVGCGGGRVAAISLGSKQMRHAHLLLSVNGEAVETSFAPYKTLLEVLREDLGLTGTKHGCELGECGACAVLIDGEPQLSCLVLALECEGRAIETVEGMARGAELHPLPAA